MKKHIVKIRCGFLIIAIMLSIGFLTSCSTLGGVFGMLFSSEPDTRITKDADLKKFFAGVRPARGNPEAYYQLGKHYQDRNLHAEAVKEFTKVVYMNPGHAPALNRLGISYDMLGKYGEAIEAYRAALKIEPNRDDIYNNLGYSCLLRGDVEEAVKAFQSAIALNGQKEIYHNNLGLAYARKNRHEMALQEFKKGGDEAEAHYNLANQYFDQGHFDKAKQNYQAALDLKPAMEPARKGIEASEALARIAKTDDGQPTGSLNPIAAATRAAEPKGADSAKKSTDGKVAGLEKGKPAGEVEVSNGNGVGRMARTVGRHLSKSDFKVVRLTNADHFNYRESLVLYRKGYENTAERIDREVPIALKHREVKSFDRPHIKVKLVIGKDVVPYRKAFLGKVQKPGKNPVRLSKAPGKKGRDS